MEVREAYAMSYFSLISQQTSRLFLAIILKISLALHKSKNSGSKHNWRETESFFASRFVDTVNTFVKDALPESKWFECSML